VFVTEVSLHVWHALVTQRGNLTWNAIFNSHHVITLFIRFYSCNHLVIQPTTFFLFNNAPLVERRSKSSEACRHVTLQAILITWDLLSPFAWCVDILSFKFWSDVVSAILAWGFHLASPYTGFSCLIHRSVKFGWVCFSNRRLGSVGGGKGTKGLISLNFRTNVWNRVPETIDSLLLQIVTYCISNNHFKKMKGSCIHFASPFSKILYIPQD